MSTSYARDIHKRSALPNSQASPTKMKIHTLKSSISIWNTKGRVWHPTGVPKLLVPYNPLGVPSKVLLLHKINFKLLLNPNDLPSATHSSPTQFINLSSRDSIKKADTRRRSRTTFSLSRVKSSKRWFKGRSRLTSESRRTSITEWCSTNNLKKRKLRSRGDLRISKKN